MASGLDFSGGSSAGYGAPPAASYGAPAPSYNAPAPAPAAQSYNAPAPSYNSFAKSRKVRQKHITLVYNFKPWYHVLSIILCIGFAVLGRAECMNSLSLLIYFEQHTSYS